MKIIIGSDHAGFAAKEKIKGILGGHEIIDVGTDSEESVDYPDYVKKLTEKVINENAMGILVCGTGIGICMAANRNPKIRAALAYSVETAKQAREHTDANVLCLGGKTMPFDLIEKIVDAFLKTPFSGGERHKRRLAKF